MNKTIVYLYSEIMPYQTIVYEALSNLGCIVHGFEDDINRQTPYVHPQIKNVTYYKKSDFSKDSLLEKVKSLNPNVLVVCGWARKDYLYVARWFKRHTNIPIVCPIDSQYLGTIKQKIGFLIAPWYIKRNYTHIWVPGVRQYDFARRLGFDSRHIVMNSLSGNVDLFNKADITKKHINYPKKFLFVGRYNDVKGLGLLADVWNSIGDKKGWKIVFAGNGPMKDKLLSLKDVEVLDFQTQEKLVKLAENTGVFLLPSKYEPWALVLQEFACAGMPILCSDTCGASPHCVINGYNGYTFRVGEFEDLRTKLIRIMNMDDEELFIWANNSRKLSQFVNPDISAFSLLSVLKQ